MILFFPNFISHHKMDNFVTEKILTFQSNSDTLNKDHIVFIIYNGSWYFVANRSSFSIFKFKKVSLYTGHECIRVSKLLLFNIGNSCLNKL